MNKEILNKKVQEYIINHLNDDVHKLAMGKSPFPHIESRELANQIAAKKRSAKKLPSWHKYSGIYYPALLSIEQCSSETTAKYKSALAVGDNLIDLTGGFGVDCHFFARNQKTVTHCEINADLSEIAAHNATVFGQSNITFHSGDGLELLSSNNIKYDTIYIDPARRSSAGKVFMLRDCTPNVVEHLDLLLSRSKRIIIKTAPLLDLSAGLKELKNVAEIHVVSTRNEVKELLWIIDSKPAGNLKIIAATLNDTLKTFEFYRSQEDTHPLFPKTSLSGYLYEPDAALLKSGAFNLIATRYGLQKLDPQTQLYCSEDLKPEFPGRIFKINQLLNGTELKKQKDIRANVISRSYPNKAEDLVKKYKIKPSDQRFLIFTKHKNEGLLIVDADIIQHY